MPFESTRSWPSFVLAVIAIGFAASLPGADNDVLVDAEVGGDDDDTLPPEDPQAASSSAAAAPIATAPPNRIVRVVRVVDIIVLIAISSSS